MEGTPAPATPSGGNGATPPPAASTPTDGGPPAAAPDWVPPQFSGDWGSDAYAEKVSRGYADAHAKLSTRTDDLRKQVSAEIEADRRRGLPEKADGYTFELPDGAEYAKLLAEHKIQLVDQLPEGEYAGEGALYALSKDSDAIGWWRDMCHRLGLPVDAYREGIARIVVRDVRKADEARKSQLDRFANEDAAVLKALGPDGAARKAAAEAGIGQLAEKLLGPEKGKAAALHLGSALLGAEGVEAIEAILKLTAGGLQPGVGGNNAPSVRPADLMFPGLAKKG